MHVKSIVAVVAAVLLCAATGCHVGGTRAGGILGGKGCDSCGVGGCQGDNCVTPETLTGDGYGVRGGHTGPLAGFLGQHHRGPQSHMGGMPGPAAGPPSPQVTYPYYTTRGPKDYFHTPR